MLHIRCIDCRQDMRLFHLDQKLDLFDPSYRLLLGYFLSHRRNLRFGRKRPSRQSNQNLTDPEMVELPKYLEQKCLHHPYLYIRNFHNQFSNYGMSKRLIIHHHFLKQQYQNLLLSSSHLLLHLDLLLLQIVVV